MNYSELKEFFSVPRSIVVTGHKSPDGDAVGSVMALSKVLAKTGHSVEMIVPDAFPKFLGWMDLDQKIIQFDEQKDRGIKAINDADVIFSLDYNTLSRVGDMESFIAESTAIKILIDHHLNPDRNFDFMLSETSASSTAELVFWFLDNMELENRIDSEIAACLYAGIMTDTGSFRFPSTGPETHRIVARLMEKGLDATKVHQNIYDTNTFDRVKMLGHILGQKLEADLINRIAYIPISLDEKNRFRYQKGDTEGVVNYGLSIQGIQMSVFLSEELGFTKLSFRSKGEIDVNKFARAWFNGGGHKNAAGGRLDKSLPETLDYLKGIIREKGIR